MQYLLRYLGEIVHQLEYSEADIHTSLVTNISCAKKTNKDLGNHCLHGRTGSKTLPASKLLLEKGKFKKSVETRFLDEEVLRMGNSQLSSLLMCIHPSAHVVKRLTSGITCFTRCLNTLSSTLPN